jgi:predicted transcriptional regulator
MTKITFPIERAMRDQLAEIAKSERRSLAFIMREAATIFLDRVSDTQGGGNKSLQKKVARGAR